MGPPKQKKDLRKKDIAGDRRRGRTAPYVQGSFNLVMEKEGAQKPRTRCALSRQLAKSP